MRQVFRPLVRPCMGLAVSAGLVLALASGCGSSGASSGASGAGGNGNGNGDGDGSSGTPGEGGLSAEEAARITCERYAECLPGYVEIVWGDVETCVERQLPYFEASLTAPGTGVTRANMTACAEATKNAACEDVLVKTPEACKRKGTLVSGAECVSDAQCASGMCGLSADRVCGVCAEAPSLGEACTSTGRCEDGAVCLGSPQTCVELRGKGESCDTANPCGGSTYCIDGTCTPASNEVGAKCGTPSDPICNPYTLHCDSTTKTCAKQRRVGAGEPCGVAGVTCFKSICDGKTCVAWVEKGGACVDDKPSCGPGTTCIDATCQYSFDVCK